MNRTYIVVRQSPAYKQMTIEDYLFGSAEKDEDFSVGMLNSNRANTKTYAVERVSTKFLASIDVIELIKTLEAFSRKHRLLLKADRRSLYYSFQIPKKSGGLRQIDAPLPPLMDALRELKKIFEEDFHALYHTSAFAYVKHRSTLDALRRHQENESRWFAKFDAHNFFGSTTKPFVLSMLSMVFPFSEIVKSPRGMEALSQAIDLAFLDGVLPQGTPISPLITNVMMIPIDFALSNTLRDFNGQRYVYTRYADDMTISSKYSFMFKSVEALILDVFRQFNAPFTLNTAKTRYGSSAGRNWNLGLMLNKDNEITVGHAAKKHFVGMLSAYAKDKRSGVLWSLYDVQKMEGLRNYYIQVEGNKIIELVSFVANKYHVNIVQEIKHDLKTLT